MTMLSDTSDLHVHVQKFPKVTKTACCTKFLLHTGWSDWVCFSSLVHANAQYTQHSRKQTDLSLGADEDATVFQDAAEGHVSDVARARSVFHPQRHRCCRRRRWLHVRLSLHSQFGLLPTPASHIIRSKKLQGHRILLQLRMSSAKMTGHNKQTKFQLRGSKLQFTTVFSN